MGRREIIPFNEGALGDARFRCRDNRMLLGKNGLYDMAKARAGRLRM
jgi:hypothetical protein